MVVFKAARRINGAYHSLYVNAVGLDLMYKLNHTTHAPDPSQLFGCLTLNDARNVAYGCGSDTVVLQGTTSAVEAPSQGFRIMSIGIGLEEMIKFWKSIRDFGSHNAAQSLIPSGTVLFPDFTPTVIIA